MNEDTRKHLEFVQQVIARMNGNSFQLKTWAVTLTAGLFALSERSNPWFALLALIPIFVFWMLDTLYLQLERRYRALYKHLCEKSGDPDYSKGKHFSMELKDYPLPSVSKLDVAFSDTLFWIYIPLLFTVALVVAGLRLFGSAGAGQF
jgi:hypothetical protein